MTRILSVKQLKLIHIIEFLYSDFGIWYKYQVKNPHPDVQVRYIRFRNTNPESNPRIGNTIQLKTRVHQLAS